MPTSYQRISSNPPDPDELEVSLFGPGVGECVVVHIGLGRWMVVDSCVDSKTRDPIALRYLRSLGVDPESAVSLIVISHWHADHIGGAARLVEVCKRAVVSYSDAYRIKEFLALLEAFSGHDYLVDKDKAATREIYRVFQIMKKRQDQSQREALGMRRAAMANRILFEDRLASTQVEIRALSPSDFTCNNAKIEFGQLFPDESTSRKAIIAPKHNDNAVVVWISFGSTSALLGADLEQHSALDSGWTAVVNAHQMGHAQIFKIPHHGSATGHCDAVWSDMLEPKPTALVTEYSPSGIPGAEDIDRLKKYAGNIFCTSAPRCALPKRDSTVERTMKEVVRSRRARGGAIGHIQVRIRQDKALTVGIDPPGVVIQKGDIYDSVES